MKLEELFEKIRSGEVSLWIGSGLSKYAGYPTADELTKVFYTKCLESVGIDESLKNLPLDRITEKYVRICNGSRSSLNKLIKDIFGKAPINTVHHDIISRIPHLNEIITTNYDCLLENSFGNRGTVIRKDIDVPLKRGNTKILKIHGDIHELGNLVITQSDYARPRNHNSPLWTYLKHIIATQDIVFLGYSYEDPNIWTLFNSITSILNEKKRKRIIVNPFIKDYDKAHLESMGFICFNLTGEDFIQQLDQNIIENIINDVQTRKTSIDVFNEYLEYRNRSASFITEKDRIIIKSIKDEAGKTETKVNFTINQSLAEELTNFNSGKSDSTEFILKSNDLFHFETTSSGLKWPLTENTISELRVIKLPINKTIEIENLDRNLSFNNIKAKVFSFHEKYRIEFELGDCNIDLTIKISGDRYNLLHTFNIKDYLLNTSENIKVFEYFLGIAQCEKNILYIDKIKLDITDSGQTVNPETINDLKWHLDILYKLRKIELSKNLRFRKMPFNEFKKFENNINYVHEIIVEGVVRFTSFDYAVKFDRNSASPVNGKIINEFIFQNESFIVVTNTAPSYKIFDENIDLGYSVVEIINPIKTPDGDSELIKSRNGEIIFRHISSINHLIQP